MAKVSDNDKGFKVIEVSRTALMGALEEYGSVGVCDNCGESPDNGFYVAVLDSWLCPECYQEWYGRATNYPEDRKCEERNFGLYRQIFEI